MRGILTAPLPLTVDVGGISLPINTSWRTWVDIWRIVDNPAKEGWKKGAATLRLAFDDEAYAHAISNPDAAFAAAMDFLMRRQPGQVEKPLTKQQKRLSSIRTMDWDWDAPLIVADYRREYGIDLTDHDMDMHWWRFMALFDGLSDTASIIDCIRVRAADLDAKGMSKDEKRYLRERKEALMLPARDKKEVAQNLAIRGNDG